MTLLLRRIAQSSLLLLALSFLSFTLLQVAPGDFFTEMQVNPRISSGLVGELREKYGLERPLLGRYWAWICSLLHGDLGFSFAYNLPVSELLRARAPFTLLLTTLSTLVAWSIAIPVGAMCAAAPHGLLAKITSLGTTTLLVIPELLIALACLLIGVRAGWARISSAHEPLSVMHSWETIRTTAMRLAMPTLALVLGSLPILIRHTTSAMREALNSAFISAAKAHGISPGRLLYRHAFPVALNPLLSLLGTSLGSLLSASLVVEVVMGYPGIGSLLLEAILNRDNYLVIGVVVLSGFLVVLGTLVTDLLLLAVDPRIRAEGLA